MYALLSVTDKDGIEQFGRRLAAIGFTLLSTGHTAKLLQAAGCAVLEVADYTGFPEVFDGRVKTLHPKIHAGILARSSATDEKILKNLGIEKIDLVVVNLYPFKEKPEIDMIDIGGPTMLRAAAKNHERVTAVCDPRDYDRVATAFEKGTMTPELRKELAAKVFAQTAAYEVAIAGWFGVGDLLRYGENPHQQARFEVVAGKRFWKEPLQGKSLSYNNIVDADAAWWLMREFRKEPFACAVVKHANPCGVAISQHSLRKVFQMTLACDATSAFGGVVVFNREVDFETAEAMGDPFFEMILAPSFSKEALKFFAKKKNLRLLEIDFEPFAGKLLRSAGGGCLVQDSDLAMETPDQWKVATKRRPTEEETRALFFSWRVCKHVKSNAIVLSNAETILGIGAGQASRVDSVKIAVSKLASPDFSGGGSVGREIVCASDAFFPFSDNIEFLAQAGITAIIQPGGSIRDDEVIQAADKYNIAMVFTGVRHFRH